MRPKLSIVVCCPDAVSASYWSASGSQCTRGLAKTVKWVARKCWNQRSSRQGRRRNRCGRDRRRLDSELHCASKSPDCHSVVGPVDYVSGIETRLTVDPARRRKKHEKQLCPSGKSESPSRRREVEATANIHDPLHPAAGALGRSTSRVSQAQAQEISKADDREILCSKLVRRNNVRDFVIETTQLAKSYKGQPALQGLNLEVGRGQIFGFLGRNGAGKTTTIKTLIGLLKAD